MKTIEKFKPIFFYIIKSRYVSVCMIVLCIRTVDTLEPNRLHIQNPYDLKVCHWPFILPKSDQWPNYRTKFWAVSNFFNIFYPFFWTGRLLVFNILGTITSFYYGKIVKVFWKKATVVQVFRLINEDLIDQQKDPAASYSKAGMTRLYGT